MSNGTTTSFSWWFSEASNSLKIESKSGSLFTQGTTLVKAPFNTLCTSFEGSNNTNGHPDSSSSFCKSPIPLAAVKSNSKRRKLGLDKSTLSLVVNLTNKVATINHYRWFSMFLYRLRNTVPHVLNGGEVQQTMARSNQQIVETR